MMSSESLRSDRAPVPPTRRRCVMPQAIANLDNLERFARELQQFNGQLSGG